MVLTTITAKKQHSLAIHSMLLKISLLLCFYSASISLAYSESLNILTTIKPIHSLVSNLTKGISQPDLLISGNQSPHDFQMKPSDRRKIVNANIIIYVSGGIESYIPEISNTFSKQQTVIALDTIAGIQKLPTRSVDEHSDHHADHDGHLWLSIENAKAISHYLYSEFSKHDPEHQVIYLQNRNQLLARLQQLKTGITDKLKQLKQKPYLTFHDAFQYYETEFNLTGSHFVTSNPEYISGIQSIQHLKKLMQTEKINCIYYEPPRIPKIIHTLKENTAARSLPLDPVGTELHPGENLYFELLDTITNQLLDCLK